MRHPPKANRFSAWDGSQKLPIDPDEVLAALADDLIESGDLRWALRRLASRGMPIPQGGYMQGLKDMLKQLREKKRAQLERFDLSSIFDGLQERLDEVLAMERERIDEWLTPSDDGEEDFSNEVLKQVAERNRETLDGLPEDLASQIRELEKYEFLNPDAQRKFLEILNELKRAMTNTFFKDIENMVANLSDGDIERMKEMVKALNDMLVKKIAGKDPGFDEFMERFGDMFGDNPPQSLDELLEQMRQQMAAAQSLMNSMSPEQQQQLANLLGDRLGDADLNSELAKLAKELDFLDPQGGQYRFSGDESLDFEAAMDLMREMQDIDELMGQLQDAERGGNLDGIDQDLVKELMGDESAEDLEQLKSLLDALEEAGYIRSTDENRWELTPRGSRMIGQKALGEIYDRLKRQSLGNHAIPEEGRFGERLEQTKPYEFGDPFHLHMPRTLTQRHRPRRAVDADQSQTVGLRDLPQRADHLDGHRHAGGSCPGPWHCAARSKPRKR